MASTAVVSKTFGFNEIDATTSIQNAFDSQYDTLIVDFTGKEWIVEPLFARSNKVIVFQPGVILMAKQGEFQGLKEALITITDASNITFLGYGAILRMRKEDYRNTSLYTHSEWRHAINIQALVNKPVENIVIRGFHIEKSGGDGICVAGISGHPSSGPVQPENILIQDIVCDNNHRDGISLTGGIGVKIVNAIIMETKGTFPMAGIDFEPDWERLQNVTMTNCYFYNNSVKGIDMKLYRPAWKGTKTINFTLNNCHVDSDDNAQGIALNIDELQDIEGSDGSIIFNDCSFRNKTIYSAISLSDKSALQAKVILNRCFIEQTQSEGSVITLSTNNAKIKDLITYGGIEFNDCIVNDRYDRNFLDFADNSGTGKGIRDLKGTLTVNNSYGAKYSLGSVTQNIAFKIIANKSNPPTINISQPAKYQSIETGANLTVTSTAFDSDVGITDGAGIQKVIYEVQYADTKVHTIEDIQAPFSFTTPTKGWDRGIYLIKAIAVSSQLEAKNISVIPIEIISAKSTTDSNRPKASKVAFTLNLNPRQNKLIIGGISSENTAYEIASVEGKSKQKGILGDGVISIDGLKAGTYLVKLKTGTGEKVQKFVKR